MGSSGSQTKRERQKRLALCASQRDPSRRKPGDGPAIEAHPPMDNLTPAMLLNQRGSRRDADNLDARDGG